MKEEARLIQDVNGIRLTDPYIVKNLTPSRRILYDALFASGVPSYEDAHPDIADLYCIHKEIFPFARTSNTEAKVICTWGPADFTNVFSPIINFHGTTREVLTNFDVNGNPIEVDYEKDGTDFPTQVGQVRSRKAEGFLSFDYVEPNDPSGLLTYLNKLNSTTFRGGAAYTYLCGDIQISKAILRSGYYIRIMFEYDEETHIRTAAYRLLGGIVPADIDTIPIPKTVTTGNGWRNVLTNNTADFNTLNLPSTF